MFLPLMHLLVLSHSSLKLQQLCLYPSPHLCPSLSLDSLACKDHHLFHYTNTVLCCVQWFSLKWLALQKKKAPGPKMIPHEKCKKNKNKKDKRGRQRKIALIREHHTLELWLLKYTTHWLTSDLHTQTLCHSVGTPGQILTQAFLPYNGFHITVAYFIDISRYFRLLESLQQRQEAREMKWWNVSKPLGQPCTLNAVFIYCMSPSQTGCNSEERFGVKRFWGETLRVLQNTQIWM